MPNTGVVHTRGVVTTNAGIRGTDTGVAWRLNGGGVYEGAPFAAYRFST
jgi:hypothetical protein